MPSYVIAEPMGDSASLLIEKFFVSLPVLTSLVLGLFYAIHQLLELEEDLLLDLNAGQDTEEEAEEQPRPEPVGGSAAAAEGDPAGEGGEEGRGGGGGVELDSREEGLFEDLARKFGVFCMLLEELLFSYANDSDVEEHSGTEPTTKKKKKKDEKDSEARTTAAKGGPKRSVSANEADQLSGKVASPVGKLSRPHLVTSVEDNGVVIVVRDDVTAIPVQVVPSSVEFTVAPADQVVGENSCGCYAAAAARCANAAQRCRSKSCQRRGGLSQVPLGDDAAPEEADRAPLTRNSSSLGFCRQTTDIDALIGRLRKLLSQHNAEREDDDVCADCDVIDLFQTTAAGVQECRRHRGHHLCCCGGTNDVRDERKPGHCICVVVKLDHKNFDTAQCRVEARETPRRQSTINNANISSRVMVETANVTKTSATRCGCSHLPHAARTFAPRVIIASENHQ